MALELLCMGLIALLFGLDWLWFGLGVLADIGSYAGGGIGNRKLIPGYSGQ